MSILIETIAAETGLSKERDRTGIGRFHFPCLAHHGELGDQSLVDGQSAGSNAHTKTSALLFLIINDADI